MKIKNLKMRLASVALSAILSSGAGLALSTPAYAMDLDVSELDLEEEIEEEEEEEDEEENILLDDEYNNLELYFSNGDNDEEANEEELANENEEANEEELANENEEANEEELANENEKANDEELANENEEANEEEENLNNANSTQSITQHTVAVVTTKVDEEGEPLKGAKLQILDEDGNVLDEWISDGEQHVSMLPEGNYVLREVSAPNGYQISKDKNFTVKVEIEDINADVIHDDSHDVCWHYGGVPLYYVESDGQKEEVYCINQGWDEPDGTNYDGLILDENNISFFAPDADPSLTNAELYNKVLDVIYHRSKASEEFPDLSETAIRFVTEYALKNYTSAMVDDGMLFRRYRYDPEVKSKHVEDIGNGDAIGQLAKHWWYYHGRTTIPEEYVNLYYYLIEDNDHHPDDMHLFIFSSKELTPDEEQYQNLIGVRWFNPKDDEYVVYLTNVNTLIKEEEPPVKPCKPHSNAPKTGDNSNLFVQSLALLGSSATLLAITKALKDDKKRTKVKK